MKSIGFGLSMLCLFSLTANAQFKLDGEFRPRTEYSHGFGTLASENQKASLFTSQRTRLNFDYSSDRIQTKLVLQDVRNWGNQAQLVGNEDFAASLHEAWAEAKLAKAFSLKMGRQELVYDNHRILGNVGWAQQGRSHDLFLLKYSGTITAHLGIAYNQSGIRTNNFYFGPDAYKSLQFLWLNKRINNLNISILALNNSVPYAINTGTNGQLTEQGTRNSQTIGGFFSGSFGRLSLSGNLYAQMGTDPFGKELKAFEYLVDGGFQLSPTTSLNLSYEYLSGTEMNESGVNHSFTPLYGTNHKFNGHMDYFFVGNHLNSIGLKDLCLAVAQKIHASSINLQIHSFSSAVDLSQSNRLGTEIDLFAIHPFGDNLKIQIGYSQLFASEGMAAIRTGSLKEVHNWAYLMFSFTPIFIR